MNWQVAYTLQNLRKHHGADAARALSGDAVLITIPHQPQVLAVISDAYTISEQSTTHYHAQFPGLDFVCGYRKECVWEGEAISYLENRKIGWGSAGTLSSAAASGKANTTTHKDFSFSIRLIHQLRNIKKIVREYDRILSVTLVNCRHLRIAMIREYEPTADAIRSHWERFGPFDIAWNINPNGDPTQMAIEAGRQLGCQVMKWEELSVILRRN
ncbi:hypothetical protein [Xanthomonas hortorum]|uniref:Uncharacterized protein n=1 Tax=Xanthomonas hortorum pv. gardneri TaxID=2754056 RepID=A0A6V7B8Z6_9XANT|nr:hypothetical protein [Xanthomonas hortorum]APP78663.1 hypothetical protein BJD10_02145 [Xanthomonas hortorum pv. gardneri]EGD17607.1 hypothetical protein XGA_3783 [Xanthomonas hortorum ATCC 19865]MCC8498823.1 hypothetical protein [Xanthomonas hortorum pv. gardneri]MCC8512066.1 hypothetical protein [Xanthomonas hortorum pv. gardneri]MCC8520304.1 hypothetical protein [Xanthomonas hortorum pv. gardneri]